MAKRTKSRNALNARGGELTPKVAPRELGLLTPEVTIFHRISVERGQFRGPLKIRNVQPPSTNGDLTPPPYLSLQIFATDTWPPQCAPLHGMQSFFGQKSRNVSGTITSHDILSP